MQNPEIWSIGNYLTLGYFAVYGLSGRYHVKAVVVMMVTKISSIYWKIFMNELWMQHGSCVKENRGGACASILEVSGFTRNYLRYREFSNYGIIGIDLSILNLVHEICNFWRTLSVPIAVFLLTIFGFWAHLFVFLTGQAIVSAVTSGSRKFFLGTDSAPHERRRKECPCGCAGIYNAPVALSLYAKVFEEVISLNIRCIMLLFFF